jgi:hypothetical protein
MATPAALLTELETAIAARTTKAPA